MPQVAFHYNLKKDAWSWVLIAKDKKTWGLAWSAQVAHIPPRLLKIILKSDFPTAQLKTERFLRNYISNSYRKLIIRQTLKALEAVWRKIEKQYFHSLELLTQKPIYRNNFQAFLTTSLMCPYQQKEAWFMISLWHSLPASITTICHEIFHLQFMHYYENFLKKAGLQKESREDFKEAVTVLLNENEFNNVILVEDQGYPKHQRLRQELRKIWQKEKNFNQFIKKAAEKINLLH